MNEMPATMVDLESEQAIIGGLLMAPSEIASVPTLHADEFWRPAHGLILNAIRTALDQSDGKVDYLVIMETLTRQGDLLKVGGGAYLHTCIAACPSVAMVGHYTRIVQEKSKRRALLAAAQRLVQAAEHPDGESAREVVASLLVHVEQLIDDSATEQPLDVVEFGAFVEQARVSAREWVIPGLLCPMDRVIIVAGEGSGKSWWSRQMAVALGQGVHPLRPSIKIPARKVLMVDLENPPGLIAEHGKRFIASATATGKWDSENVYLWSRPDGIDLRTASDVALLDRVMTHVRPSLMCLGPLYKASTSGSDRGEQVASEVSGALDKLRVKHRCALWLEHHAPMEQQGGRMMRPMESGLWSRWPEFGRTLVADTEDRSGKTWMVGRFRRDRDERIWPDYMVKADDWPWEARWDAGVPFAELTNGIAA